MKKIQAAYPTIEETTAKVEQLLQEGYRSDNITVVAKKEKIEAIKSQIIAEVEPVTTVEESPSVWEKVKQVFSNEEDSPLGKYHFSKKQTEEYTKAIKNGEYVVIIDDDTDHTNEERKEEAIPIVPTGNNTASGFGAIPIIPGVGVNPGAAKEGTEKDNLDDPTLPPR
ncbi:MAG: general stress protein [Carnobacterium sp.]|uniref:general stress protein n=1 Tax=Carnobacterium sp. TaxID=48221 RepID=UPI003315DD32